MLNECLERQKENMRMTSNSSWHSAAWVDAKKALDGSEKSSGGGKKTGVSCQNHWTAVHSLFYSASFILFCVLAKKGICPSQAAA